jgi:2-oxoglutarate dehydrogenase E2 component (dihydrolipoamide succinyltransferase)
MREVAFPRQNPNDERYLLVEWLVADGSEVRAGEPLAAVETSKVSADLESPCDGVVRQLVPSGGWYDFDQIIARIHDTDAPDDPSPAPAPAIEDRPAPSGQDEPLLSRSAAELAAAHGLGPREIREASHAAGSLLVRRADVERYVAAFVDKPAPAELDVAWDLLPPGQRAVADAVARSHHEVPTAFTVVKVDLRPAEAWLRGSSGDQPRFRGLTELLVQAIARQATDFPAFFCASEGGTRRLGADPHVGVTIDVGRGLRLPVIRRPDRKTLAEIGDELMRLRLQAARGSLTAQQSAGATIMLSVNADPDTLFALPIIFPGLTCALSWGAAITEAVLEPDGGIAARPTAALAIAYDHRVVNGRDAYGFLRAVKAWVEAPDRLEHLSAGADGAPEDHGEGAA